MRIPCAKVPSSLGGIWDLICGGKSEKMDLATEWSSEESWFILLKILLNTRLLTFVKPVSTRSIFIRAEGQRPRAGLPAGSFLFWVVDQPAHTRGKSPSFFGTTQGPMHRSRVTSPSIPRTIDASAKLLPKWKHERYHFGLWFRKRMAFTLLGRPKKLVIPPSKGKTKK